MNRILAVGATACAVAAAAYFATRDTGAETAAAPEDGAPIVSVLLPGRFSAEAEIGKRAFEATCIACHGQDATGIQGSGPPLVHKIYEPSHHGDMAFQMAVQRGVQAHHWSFGDMPAQPGLTPADVRAITTYVREMQRANRIN